MIETSTEVAFQKGSPLSVGLTTVFADVLRFKNQFQGDSKDRSRAVLEYVAKTMVPAMSKVITGTTGLKVNTVELSQTFSCNFGVQMYLGDNPANACLVLSRCVGDFINVTRMHRLMNENEMTPISYEDLMKIQTSFEKKVGYVRNDLIPDKLPIAIDIFFDPYAAFLVDELHPEAPILEAQEITAVMLHEIGHMMSLLEICAETHYQHDIMRRSVAYFGQHAPVSEVAAYVRETLSSNNSELPDGFMEKLSAGLKTRSNIFSRIIIGVYNLLSLLGIVLLPIIGLQRIFLTALDAIKTANLNIPGIKGSETRGHISQLKQIENYADNYVARHGYGSNLLSGLAKMDKWLNAKIVLGRVGKMAHLQWAIAKVPTYVSAILFGNTKYRYDEHSSWTDRAKNIMEETLKIFKNDNLPPDVLAYYLNDYKTCSIMIYNRATEIKLRDNMESFWKFVEYVMITPIAIFTTARFDQEYEKLIKYVESLKNNKLLYYKAYFQNKLNNM